MDCVTGARHHLADGSVDLLICDPPYGIEGHRLHRHYNRDESYVIDGYVEVPAGAYREFTYGWIEQAARVLKPGGALYVISGYTNLRHILNALARTELTELNHIIWKYNFGVYTSRKYVSSHYHILYWVKPGAAHIFNTFCRYGEGERTLGGGSANYADREDVWLINRTYKPGQTKNKNQLPDDLLIKLIQYSSNEGDLVADFFLGSFSTARVALGLGRRAAGFELSTAAYDYHMAQLAKLEPRELLRRVRVPAAARAVHRGKPITARLRQQIIRRYGALRRQGHSQRAAIEVMAREFGRGYWSLKRVIDDERAAAAAG